MGRTVFGYLELHFLSAGDSVGSRGLLVIFREPEERAPMANTSVSICRPSVAIAVLLAGLGLGGSCGGPDVDVPATLHGRVWCGGPVAGAAVRVYQLVDGAQLGLLAMAVTDADGRFDARAAGYQHLLVVAD